MTLSTSATTLLPLSFKRKVIKGVKANAKSVLEEELCETCNSNWRQFIWRIVLVSKFILKCSGLVVGEASINSFHDRDVNHVSNLQKSDLEFREIKNVNQDLAS